MNRGLSDHSGRQGKIISITPSVAHKNTNSSTPTRRNHTRATEGEGFTTDTGTSGTDPSSGGLSSPTLVVLLAKGSLGSEISGSEIMHASSFVRAWDGCGRSCIPSAKFDLTVRILRLQSLYALAPLCMFCVRSRPADDPAQW